MTGIITCAKCARDITLEPVHRSTDGRPLCVTCYDSWYTPTMTLDESLRDACNAYCAAVEDFQREAWLTQTNAGIPLTHGWPVERAKQQLDKALKEHATAQDEPPVCDECGGLGDYIEAEGMNRHGGVCPACHGTGRKEAQ